MSLINLVVVAISAWADWRRRRRAYHELMALDDRSLADIGLRRTDISVIARERVSGEGVDAQGAAAALSAILAKPVFGHRGLSPVWPQL
jgi:uncharacterized protein YjiS (DUF1127 family)